MLVNDDDYERSDGVIRRSARSTRSEKRNPVKIDPVMIDLSSSKSSTTFHLSL